MEGRLSEYTVKATWDAGHRSLPWQPGPASGFLGGVDFDAILANPNSKAIIQSLPVQSLYVGLKKRGFAACLDVLPLLSQDQVIRISDFDCWHKGRLDSTRMIDLMESFGEVSDKQLYERFAFLDEEYQIATLQGLLQVYEEEEFADFPQELQDQCYAMPCNKVFYRILSDDPKTEAFVTRLIKASCEYNLRYTYSLLAHAAYDVPNEAEEMITRFRNARLEEDGFLSFEESLTFFNPVDLEAYKEKWHKHTTHRGAMLASHDEGIPFINRVLDKAQQENWEIDEQYQVHLGLLTLANAISTSVGVEPDDTKGLVRVLEQCQALTGLGMDYLSQGDLSLALDILKAEHPKILFGIGLTLVNDLRSSVLQYFKTLDMKQADFLWSEFQSQRWGSIGYYLDTECLDSFGFELVEILKGLFNRFPMTPMFLKKSKNIQFCPLYSLNEFARLQEFSWAVVGLLFLKTLGKASQEQHLDQAITTMMANVLLNKGLRADPLSPEDLESLFAMTNIFREQVMGQIKTSLMQNKEIWHPESFIAQTITVIENILNGLCDGLIEACQSKNLSGSLILKS